MRVNIIGGGLAGCALAYVLKNNGCEPVIYEAGSALASGASGNDVGLYNPRFTAQYDAVREFYTKAFFEALRVFDDIGAAADWDPCGALHLMNNPQKEKRYPKTVEAYAWPDNGMQILTPEEASEVAGVDILSGCLYLQKSGKISPKKLCSVYASGVECHLSAPISSLEDLDGDITVLACGSAAKQFDIAKHLPIKPVRGQVSYIAESEVSSRLKTALCFGGYIAPAQNGVHCLGSTFQRWLDHDNVIAEDDMANIEKLCDEVKVLAYNYNVVNSKAGVRTVSQDHFPIVGQLGERVFISTAHGSHGILSSLLSAIILTDIILGAGNQIVNEGTMMALSPKRFVVN